MQSVTRMIALTLVVGLLVSLGQAMAADWPCWRGPNHDGKPAETGFAKTWDKAGPKVLWERDLGAAYSSFVCVGDHVFTCGTQDEKQVIFCLDAKTGKTIWQQPYEDGYSDGQGDGTRATPTIDEGRLYLLGPKGTLVCLDAKDGKQIWKQSFGGAPQWGYSGSVLIEGDLAVVSPGGADGALLALDKKTGKSVWKCGKDAAGYATPYPFTFEGTRYICGFMAKSAIVAEAKTGKLAWSVPWETDWDVNAATPIYHEGHLFLASGYHTGCALFKLAKAEDGKLSAKEVWRSKVLMSKFHTPILYEGNLYTSDQEALKCVNFMTGELKWRQRRVKHGTLVIADGTILLHTEDGDLKIAKATPQGWEPKAEAKVLHGNRCWTVPVLSNKRLYMRDMDRAVCLDLAS